MKIKESMDHEGSVTSLKLKLWDVGSDYWVWS